MTEEYIATFKPNGYARTFGRAMTNTKCGGVFVWMPSHPQYAPPSNAFGCGATEVDIADLSLSVTINDVTTTETVTKVPEVAVYELFYTVNKTLDVELFIPLKGIESGNIG